MNKKELFKQDYLKTGCVKKSAKNCGISETIVYKWFDNGLREEIKSIQKARNDEALHEAITELNIHAKEMACELIDAIKNERSPPMLNAKANAITKYFEIINSCGSNEDIELQFLELKKLRGE